MKPKRVTYRPVAPWALPVLAGLLAAAGCGPGEELVAVTGRVTYKGAPLARGTIVFTPDPTRGGSGPLARAEIQPDGGYALHTGDAPGATPGWHRVAVVAVEDAAPPAGQRFVVPRSLVPEKYRDPERSGLGCEVRPGKDNKVNFNLD